MERPRSRLPRLLRDNCPQAKSRKPKSVVENLPQQNGKSREEAGASAAELPPLVVGIYEADGSLDRTIELRDPRTLFCRFFNELAGTSYAAPIVGKASRKGGAR